MKWIKDKTKLIIISTLAALGAWAFFYFFQQSSFYILPAIALIAFIIKVFHTKKVS